MAVCYNADNFRIFLILFSFMQHLESLLRQIGLTEKEAVVYVTLLSLGETTAQEVAKKARINRPTAYAVMITLEKKGLAAQVDRERVKLFVAQAPRNLIKLVEGRESDLAVAKDSIAKLLPSLEQMVYQQDDPNRPKIRFLEGKDGVLRAARDMAERAEGDKIFTISPRDLVDVIMTKDDIEYIKHHRNVRKYFVHHIYTRKAGSLGEHRMSERYHISDEKTYPISAEIAAYDNKVALMTLKDKLMAVVIENKDIAETIKTLHKLAMLGAKTLQKK